MKNKLLGLIIIALGYEEKISDHYTLTQAGVIESLCKIVSSCDISIQCSQLLSTEDDKRYFWDETLEIIQSDFEQCQPHLSWSELCKEVTGYSDIIDDFETDQHKSYAADTVYSTVAEQGLLMVGMTQSEIDSMREESAHCPTYAAKNIRTGLRDAKNLRLVSGRLKGDNNGTN